MAALYRYEKRRIIHIHGLRNAAGMEVAEVTQGVETLHRGTPYGCLCWLADQGDKKAQAQLATWRRAQEQRSRMQQQEAMQALRIIR